MLPRANRLRARAAFRAVYERGRAIRGSLLHIRYLRSRAGSAPPRVGIVVSKTISKKATKRNAMRRRLREAMRQALVIAPAGYDLVLIVRRQAIGRSFQEFLNECTALLRRLPSITNTMSKK